MTAAAPVTSHRSKQKHKKGFFPPTLRSGDMNSGAQAVWAVAPFKVTLHRMRIGGNNFGSVGQRLEPASFFKEITPVLLLLDFSKLPMACSSAHPTSAAHPCPRQNGRPTTASKKWRLEPMAGPPLRSRKPSCIISISMLIRE